MRRHNICNTPLLFHVQDFVSETGLQNHSQVHRLISPVTSSYITHRDRHVIAVINRLSYTT